MKPIWQFDDGGRGAAGFKGKTGDCVCRAIAIATGISPDGVMVQVASRQVRRPPR
jgi:hypothetical protein